MRNLLIIATTLLLTSSVSSRAQATTVRYALIVGSNVGTDSDGTQPFPPLKHAEREARVLKDRLVGLSNFDSSSKRTKLLVGVTSEQVRTAVQALVRQKKRDVAQLGELKSVFLFYFTGHGLEGRFLLKDGPMAATELGELLESVDADFTVSVFDACYSGGLMAKGIEAAPGLNLFRELPQEVLAAEGNVWYVSSGPGQASYEDEQLGGVFTHFFIEALERADRDGPGITLDRIWQYTRQRTVEYTAERNRRQIPEQYITKLHASSPIYFSFPMKRSATLVMSESLEGQFALAYADGLLTELIHKAPNRARQLAVFPGKAKLQLFEKGKIVAEEELVLTAGGRTVLSQALEETPAVGLGQQRQQLWEKGIGLEQKVTAATVQSGLTVLLGADYGFRLAPRAALSPRHAFAFNLRLDYDQIIAGLKLGYGMDRREFPAWRFRADAAQGELRAGYGWDLGPTRLTLSASFGVSHIWQEYGDGEQRQAWQLWPWANIGLLLPRTQHVCGELFIGAGPTRSPGVGVAAEEFWHFSAGLGLALYFRPN